MGLYYVVDTDFFRPPTSRSARSCDAVASCRRDKFVIFLSSRISHEKDPETVLRATARARSRGLNAVLINLGGGYRDFLKLAGELRLPDAERWVMGRPAAHPMIDVADYFRAADVMALASLAEGAAYSTLESLACATPVVATDIGGMAVQLKGYARLVPRRDAEAMADQFLWIADNPAEARAQAQRGREYVVREWDRRKAFDDLRDVLEAVAEKRNPDGRKERPCQRVKGCRRVRECPRVRASGGGRGLDSGEHRLGRLAYSSAFRRPEKHSC